ncbi:hypothetical protein C2W62_40200 [Candidatus Entotheonella serta]|nr:hypothetical protein C2W62_40200 [Candidatus Entotheonella serta]
MVLPGDTACPGLSAQVLLRPPPGRWRDADERAACSAVLGAGAASLQRQGEGSRASGNSKQDEAASCSEGV